MSRPLAMASAVLWSRRYEDLRGYALEGRQNLGADPLGLELMCRRGLAGWMRAWQAMPPLRPALSLPSPEPQFPLAPLWQQELTLLLAQMTTQQLAAA